MPVRKCAVALFLAAAATPVASQATSFTTLYDFPGGAGGSYPSAALTPFNGALFGTTTGGSSSANPASIFQVNPATGAVSNTVLPPGYQFLGSLLPVGTLLYGAAEAAPSAEYGIIYSFDPATGTLLPIYAFKGSNDGAYPLGELAEQGGLLYGTTVGGATFHGTLFSVNPATGQHSVLFRFNGTDGDQPSAGVTYAFGALFGTTYDGGAHNQGEVFRFDLATHKLAILHSFSGGADGGSPVYSGITAVNGALYGVTLKGGTAGAGTVYRMDPYDGTETVLYSFTGSTDGASPLCNLVVSGDALYGTTQFAGAHELGTIFRIDIATGKATILHAFSPATPAPEYGPNAGLTLFSGALYGVTTYNGASNYGTVFKVEP